MVTGWVRVSFSKYYFNESQDGSLGQGADGWRFIDGYWYWFEDGKAATYNREVDGVWQHFNSSGKWKDIYAGDSEANSSRTTGSSGMTTSGKPDPNDYDDPEDYADDAYAWDQEHDSSKTWQDEYDAW